MSNQPSNKSGDSVSIGNTAAKLVVTVAAAINRREKNHINNQLMATVES